MDYDELVIERKHYSGAIEANRVDIEKVYNSRQVKNVRLSKSGVSLFTFFLQLVSYLKSIGTVGAIDVNAYLNAIDEQVDVDI